MRSPLFCRSNHCPRGAGGGGADSLLIRRGGGADGLGSALLLCSRGGWSGGRLTGGCRLRVCRRSGVRGWRAGRRPGAGGFGRRRRRCAGTLLAGRRLLRLCGSRFREHQDQEQYQAGGDLPLPPISPDSHRFLRTVSTLHRPKRKHSNSFKLHPRAPAESARAPASVEARRPELDGSWTPLPQPYRRYRRHV